LPNGEFLLPNSVVLLSGQALKDIKAAGLLAQQSSVGSGVVRLNHVDGESIVLAGVAQTVGDVGLGLAVTTDVVDLQVQQIVVLLQQGLISGAQEVIGGIVDVEPDSLFGMSGSIQLSGNGL